MADSSRFIPTPVFREKRRAQVARTELFASDGAPIAVLVRDVSRRGLSAMALGEVPGSGDVVSVRLPDGREFWGQVRWVEGRGFGVEFDMAD